MTTTYVGNLSASEASLFYFKFERDFVDAGLKCIPMCVRHKLDTVGIKLSLETWCKLNSKERLSLATLACFTKEDILRYDAYLDLLIANYDLGKPLRISTDITHPLWNTACFERVRERCNQFNLNLLWEEWLMLSELERFALSKLIKPGHESKNFFPALKEFGLLKKWTDEGNE